MELEATPQTRMVPVAPSISHRLCADSKYGMYEFMLSLELAMTALSNLASTVVEKTDLKSRTKWIAEVEINLMSKIFVVPREGGRG